MSDLVDEFGYDKCAKLPLPDKLARFNIRTLDISDPRLSNLTERIRQSDNVFIDNGTQYIKLSA